MAREQSIFEGVAAISVEFKKGEKPTILAHRNPCLARILGNINRGKNQNRLGGGSGVEGGGGS